MPFGLLARGVCALALIGYGDGGAQSLDWQKLYFDGMSALQQGRLADARAALPVAYEAAAKLREGEPGAILAKARGALGLASLRLAEGDARAAERLYIEARERAESAGDRSNLLASIWSGLVEAYVAQLRFDEAENAIREAMSRFLSDSVGRQGIFLCRRRMGEIRIMRGDLPGAEKILLPLIADERKGSNNGPALASALTALARVYMAEARWQESESDLKEAAALERSSGDEAALADTTLALAALYRAEGRLERAAPLLRKVVKTYTALGDPRLAFAYGEMAMCAETEGKYLTARRLFEQAVTSARGSAIPERVIAAMQANFANAEVEFATSRKPRH